MSSLVDQLRHDLAWWEMRIGFAGAQRHDTLLFKLAQRVAMLVASPVGVELFFAVPTKPPFQPRWHPCGAANAPVRGCDFYRPVIDQHLHF